jgi:HPr kinase/phosphorylase
MPTIKVKQLMNKIQFDTIYATETSVEKQITSSDITRPGLEMGGYLAYYTPERIQLFGTKEWSYMNTIINSDDRYDALLKVFVKETPAIIFSRNLEIPDEMIAAAKKFDITVLRSADTTSRITSALNAYLDEVLAERTSVHGVFMDIFGTGVLIQGSSGIGKSETGLELVKRGHRLIADDRVDVYQKDLFTVNGEPAEILRHMIELRGVGIIDVMSLFGAGAVKESGQVEFSVFLEAYDNSQAYDRLGNGDTTIKLAGVDVPQVKIPVTTGRNVSVIIEAAVMNFRARQMGYDATKTFEDRLTNLISDNS